MFTVFHLASVRARVSTMSSAFCEVIPNGRGCVLMVVLGMIVAHPAICEPSERSYHPLEPGVFWTRERVGGYIGEVRSDEV